MYAMTDSENACQGGEVIPRENGIHDIGMIDSDNESNDSRAEQTNPMSHRNGAKAGHFEGFAPFRLLPLSFDESNIANNDSTIEMRHVCSISAHKVRWFPS